jgi:membrane protease YdiL (CAAX protease family)
VRLLRLPLLQWAWLAGALTATMVTVAVMEHDRWRVGFDGFPRAAVRELALGALFASVLIGAADACVEASTGLRHFWLGRFPWGELFGVYVPAAVHEELVFRGYPYQKLRSLNRPFAIAATALIFAAMHLGNHGITAIALANLVCAGVLLALCYERYRRLWLPIGLHLTWNLLSGPILGYDVSGFVPGESLLVTRGRGPVWLTGGEFGIEGSIWIVVVELVGIVLLLLNARRSHERIQERT